MNKIIQDAKKLVENQQYAEAFYLLQASINPHSDYVEMERIAKFSETIYKQLDQLKPIKLAILASTTIDNFAISLKFWLATEGFLLETWIAPFNSIASSIYDDSSDLYNFNPDLVWVFTTYRDLHLNNSTHGDDNENIEKQLNFYQNLWEKMHSKLNCFIIQNNADIPAVDPFSNFASQLQYSNKSLYQSYNLSLGQAATLRSNIIIFDLDSIAANFGRNRWTDYRYWYHSKHAYSFQACGVLTFQASRVVLAVKGVTKKCIVLDLDNTLWGGVIGDDGLTGIVLGNGADGEAYVDFQKYILSLKQRGIILSVCSKNEEENAKLPFLKHPDMMISLEDITVFKSNWLNKVDNIREIANTLNIGLDSIVFCDDNPVERNLVRTYLPMVSVPELPADPASYISVLDECKYFETISFSLEDQSRTNYYKANTLRVESAAKYTNIDEYLSSLNMIAESGFLNDFNLKRMAQLVNKSNQFELTGNRYSENELIEICNRKNWYVKFYKLIDKYGDNGLISVVVLDADSSVQIRIDTWVMSCRVLSRTMEEFICNDIINLGIELNKTILKGCYVPSNKNKLVSNLFEKLGFVLCANISNVTFWELALSNKELKKTQISNNVTL